MTTAGRVDGRARPAGFRHRRRVLDTGVVNADHHVRHRLFDQEQVPEGQITFVQLAISNESLEHAMHVIANALGASVFERSGRCLDRVGDHDDRRFLTARPWAGVAEIVLSDVKPLLESLPEEVPLDRGALMLLDDLPDGGGETCRRIRQTTG